MRQMDSKEELRVIVHRRQLTEPKIDLFLGLGIPFMNHFLKKKTVHQTAVSALKAIQSMRAEAVTAAEEGTQGTRRRYWSV